MKEKQESMERARRDADAMRARCRTLRGFINEAWPHIPALADTPYIDNWHLRFCAIHLEWVTSGKFLELGYQNRLQFNIPPGTMKSLLVSVFWPAWEWTLNPRLQYLCTSYREEFCKRDSGRMRDLVMSEWYQHLFGVDHKVDGKTVWGVKLRTAGELKITNTMGGWREGVPFGSLTGNRGDRVIIDDPHSVDTAESEAQKARAELRFRESVPHRLNDPKKSAIVVMMQRLSPDDICGVIEKLGLPYIRVVLPMEYEADRKCVTPVGPDPRRVEGELLFPARFPREVIERDKIPLGPNGVAGQLQQRPFARGGVMFRRDWLVTVPAAPGGCMWARHWDLAASKRKGSGYGQAWTAGLKLGRSEAGNFYISNVARLQDDGDVVRLTILNTSELDGEDCLISLPQDPGQAGVVQKRDYLRVLAGKRVSIVKETGDKVLRAEPLVPLFAGGILRIVRTGDPALDYWIEPFVGELISFPTSAVRDQVDALSGAFAALQRFAQQRGEHWQGEMGVEREADYGDVGPGEDGVVIHPDHSNVDPMRDRMPRLEGTYHPDKENGHAGNSSSSGALWD